MHTGALSNLIKSAELITDGNQINSHEMDLVNSGEEFAKTLSEEMIGKDAELLSLLSQNSVQSPDNLFQTTKPTLLEKNNSHVLDSLQIESSKLKNNLLETMPLDQNKDLQHNIPNQNINKATKLVAQLNRQSQINENSQGNTEQLNELLKGFEPIKPAESKDPMKPIEFKKLKSSDIAKKSSVNGVEIKKDQANSILQNQANSILQNQVLTNDNVNNRPKIRNKISSSENLKINEFVPQKSVNTKNLDFLNSEAAPQITTNKSKSKTKSIFLNKQQLKDRFNKIHGSIDKTQVEFNPQIANKINKNIINLKKYNAQIENNSFFKPHIEMTDKINKPL